jgi:hypothetical protein
MERVPPSPTGTLPSRHELVPLRVLIRVIVVLVVAAAGTGLVWSDGGASSTYVTPRGETVQLYGTGLYRYDSLLAGAGHRGVDAALLLLAVPLLVVAGAFHRRGSQRGTLVLTATLAAVLYVYVTLALGASYNELLLVYTTVTAASTLALAQVVPTIDLHRLRAGHPARAANAVGVFLIVVGIMTAVVWLILIVGPHLTHSPPALGGATTYFTPAIDFAFVIPGIVLAGILIRRRHRTGYVLAVPLLGILVFLGPAMVGQTISHALAGLSFSAQEIVTYIATFAIMSGGGALAMRSLLLAAGPPTRPRVADHGPRTRGRPMARVPAPR